VCKKSFGVDPETFGVDPERVGAAKKVSGCAKKGPGSVKKYTKRNKNIIFVSLSVTNSFIKNKKNMTRKDYLPSNVLKLQNLVKNICAGLAANRFRWNISEEEAAALTAPVAAFNAAVEVSENPLTRTSATIKKREEARTALLEILRPFIQGRLEYNKLVTGDDLLAMGLPVHDRKPTPSPDPTEEPEATVATPLARRRGNPFPPERRNRTR
jgi:hypothetical protein